jgi:5'-methylthioadenosine phosphorylase
VTKVDVALIGGTGVGERLAALGGQALFVPTPFGTVRGRFVDHDGLRIVLVSRHSAGHKTAPHNVNFEAIADGLRRLGVRGCLATAAVGSLRDDWCTGTFAACTDFIDATGRQTTLFDREVRHTDFSSPFPLHGLFEDSQSPCVYAGMNGPRYETPFEVALLRKLGADVVGMTAANEAIAMREAGVPYGCLAIVTNLGCGISDRQLDHGEVGDAMRTHGDKIVAALLEAARRIA